VVFVYLNEYSYILCRLDTGGETNPKSHVSRDHPGVKTAFYSLKGAISVPKLSRFVP
jgi:hypothetical protein